MEWEQKELSSLDKEPRVNVPSVAGIICSVGLNYQTFLKKATEWDAEFDLLWTLAPSSHGTTIEFFTVNTKLAASQTMWINSLVVARQNVAITFIHSETTLS